MQRPVGTAYPNWFRENVSNAQGTLQERASQFAPISTRTVQRVDQRVRNTGIVDPFPHDGGREYTLHDNEAAVLAMFKMHYPTAFLKECKSFIEAVTNRGLTLSLATISRDLERMGFSRKRMQYFSIKRDEEDRVNYWCNGPDHPERPGVFGVDYRVIVYLDESGFFSASASRVYGHSFAGTPARSEGRPPRDSSEITLLAAVDARVGVIQSMMYPHGTTNEKFYVFIVLLLLPSIRGTGPRIITMDNLSAHEHPLVVNAIRAEGHRVIFRQIHSPDFGPVEWVFQMVDLFLKHHDVFVTKDNFRQYIQTALTGLTPHYIAGFFADAHFPVPGFDFRPYLGDN